MKIKRTIAFIIDFYIVLFIASIFNYVTFNLWHIECFTFFGVFLLFFKDLTFRNRSIGKKMFKLEICNYDGEVPSILNLILRNITMIIWPIEFILVVVKNNRITDMIFKTAVIEKPLDYK